jgi:SP family general alpha glucoside:H+ symporter-like MFS transporter
MIAVSVVFANIADFTPRAFQIPFASQWAFSGFAMVAPFLMPESPVYYMTKGKPDQSTKALRRLYGSKRNLEQLAQIIRFTIEHEEGKSAERANASYAECFKGTDARRTRIVCLLHSLQQLIGVSLISNSTYFFIVAGMSPTQSLTVNQIGIGLSMAGTIVSWYILSKCGRRNSILGGFVLAGLLFLAMGIAGCFPNSAASLKYVTFLH